MNSSEYDTQRFQFMAHFSTDYLNCNLLGQQFLQAGILIFHEHIALIKYLALVMAFELKCTHDIKF